MAYEAGKNRGRAEDAGYDDGGMGGGYEQGPPVPPAPPTPAPSPAPAESNVDQLKELAELHSSGALSDDEFAAAKAKILGS